MPLAVRDECQVTRPQRSWIGSFHFEPALTGRHDVEHECSRHRGVNESPWCRELAATVERAAHPQEIERFPEWIDRSQRLSHAIDATWRDVGHEEDLDE
jgi:hypothetical protein